MKRKNSSKMNTTMASGTVEKSTQENIGCSQHSTTVLSVTYFLYQPTIFGEKIILENWGIKNCRMCVFQVTVIHFQLFCFWRRFEFRIMFLFQILIVRAISPIYASMFFLLFHCKERILLSDVRLTYFRLITQKSTTWNLLESLVKDFEKEN